MKTIVAPTDFSAISLNAVNYAADLACVIGADLALIHVYSIPVVISEVPVPAYSLTSLITDAEEQMKQLKEKIMFSTRDRIKINTEVTSGDVISEVDDYCAKVNPYAVVMGAESTGTLERFLLGGKTISAMKHFSWPLIIVPPDIKFTNIRKIGLACDFRKVVETIPVKEIRSLMEKFHAEFHVLHVSTESGDSFSDETVEESRWLQDIIGEFNPKYHFINDIDIEKGIVEFTERNNLDLLIIIPKKHNLINKIFQHSHSRRLVLHTHVPVMAVHE
jgi:nucleotide-binding universal stress UspA family protein